MHIWAINTSSHLLDLAPYWQKKGHTLHWCDTQTAPDTPPNLVVVAPVYPACILRAWELAKKNRVPYVILAPSHKLTPPTTLWQNLLHTLTPFFYRNAQALIADNKQTAIQLAQDGFNPEKIYMVPHGVSEQTLGASNAKETDEAVHKLRGELQLNALTKVLLYLGPHSEREALGQIIDAARTMLHRSDVLFLFVGEGSDKNRLKKLAKGMPNVQFIDPPTPEKNILFYRMAYACFTTLKDTPETKDYIPTHLFQILASKTPVIACAHGETKALLQQSNAAHIVPPECPETLVDAIDELIESGAHAKKMGDDGYSFVSEHYLLKNSAEQYMMIFKKVGGYNDDKK